MKLKTSLFTAIFAISLGFGFGTAAHASDLKMCMGNPLLTGTLSHVINTDYVPTLPAEMIKSLGNLGGKDPKASIAGVDVSIVGTGSARALQIVLRDVRYSSRFLDTPIFAGPRVGVKGNITARAALGTTADGKRFVLQNVSAASSFSVDLGGTIGSIIGPMLTAIANAFAVNGKLGRTLAQQMTGAQLPLTLFSNTVAVDGKNASIGIQVTRVDLLATEFCIEANIQ